MDLNEHLAVVVEAIAAASFDDPRTRRRVAESIAADLGTTKAAADLIEAFATFTLGVFVEHAMTKGVPEADAMEYLRSSVLPDAIRTTREAET